MEVKFEENTKVVEKSGTIKPTFGERLCTIIPYLSLGRRPFSNVGLGAHAYVQKQCSVDVGLIVSRLSVSAVVALAARARLQ